MNDDSSVEADSVMKTPSVRDVPDGDGAKPDELEASDVNASAATANDADGFPALSNQRPDDQRVQRTSGRDRRPTRAHRRWRKRSGIEVLRREIWAALQSRLGQLTLVCMVLAVLAIHFSRPDVAPSRTTSVFDGETRAGSGSSVDASRTRTGWADTAVATVSIDTATGDTTGVTAASDGIDATGAAGVSAASDGTDANAAPAALEADDATAGGTVPEASLPTDRMLAVSTPATTTLPDAAGSASSGWKVHAVADHGSLWNLGVALLGDAAATDLWIDGLTALDLPVDALGADQAVEARLQPNGAIALRASLDNQTVYSSVQMEPVRVESQRMREVAFEISRSFTNDARAAGLPDGVIDEVLLANARYDLELDLLHQEDRVLIAYRRVWQSDSRRVADYPVSVARNDEQIWSADSSLVRDSAGSDAGASSVSDAEQASGGEGGTPRP